MKLIHTLIGLPVLALALSAPLHAQMAGSSPVPQPGAGNGSSLSGSMNSSGSTNPSGMSSSDNAQARSQVQSNQAAWSANGFGNSYNGTGPGIGGTSAGGTGPINGNGSNNVSNY